MSRTSNSRGANRKFPVLIIIILIAVVAAAGVAGELISRRLPTKEPANLAEIYGSEEGYAAIIANHELIESRALWQLDHAYLPYSVIRNELNSRFYWDPVEELLLYTLPEETVRVDSEAAYDGAPVFVLQDDTAYISLSFVQQYTDIQVEHFENPNRMVLRTQWKSEQVGTLKRKAAVRVLGGIRSKVVTWLEAGEEVTLLNPMDHWTEVQTPNGFLGYVANGDIGEVREVKYTSSFVEPDYTGTKVDYSISLIWHQVFENSGLAGLQEFLKEGAAVTTISPTWFTVALEDGTITSNADPEYVQAAHAAGLDVWPLVENINIETRSADLLQATSHREALIANLMEQLEACGADGINVDFESISEEAGDGFIQFVRELSVECRKRGLVLSVDDNTPGGGIGRYHIPEQGVVADYVMVMAYDEHYRGSDPGSTASLPYVEAAVRAMLNQVPQEKLVVGVPFYTRLWSDSSEGLTSEAMGMGTAAAFVQEHGLSVSWLEDLSQNYAHGEEDGVNYQIWLEDEESMSARLTLLDTYDTAGLAFWKLGMETGSVWNVIRPFTGLPEPQPEAAGSTQAVTEPEDGEPETAEQTDGLAGFTG